MINNWLSSVFGAHLHHQRRQLLPGPQGRRLFAAPRRLQRLQRRRQRRPPRDAAEAEEVLGEGGAVEAQMVASGEMAKLFGKLTKS